MDEKSVINIKLVNGCAQASVAVVTFNTNVIDRAFLKQLNYVLDQLEQFQDIDDDNQKITGAVFISNNNKIFLAGADLYAMQENIMCPMLLDGMIRTGQDTFNRINKLKIPTVAAIHGACLGGGLELSLACDYRICSNDSVTKIGLPEVNLGILPAWGGTTRLPRLIGLPNALTAILTGKIHAAKPAKKVGIVDKIVHKENLESAAVAIVRGKTPPKRCRSVLEYVPSTLVFSKAKKNVLKKTKGNYPAPLKIIEVMKECDSLSVRDSLRLEAQAFLELAQTDECKSLLRIFFLQEKSKKTTVKEWVATRDWSLPISVNNAVVVGAGTMGAGIAQWLTSRGVNVLLKDVNSDAVSAGLQTVGDLYVDGVRGHKFDRPTARNGLARITATTTDVPLHSKDILIEAIVEKLDVKQKVLAQLEEKLSNDAIIATNTSALSIDEMAKCLKRPERFIGIHFFNPVHKMKLVEIVKGSKTSDETVYRAIKFVQQIGKFPVVVNDGPGFVVNRILVPYLVKAAELLGQGTQMEAIDSAMVKFGMPMGPFRLMDEIGLDVCYHVARDLETRLNITCYLEEIKWRVDCKRLGKKSGHGFYYYSKGKCLREKITDTVDISPLIDCMTSEARKILDEGIIDDPDMLDFAMIMGTGWAPFRGGPIYYDQLKPTATVARSQPASSS